MINPKEHIYGILNTAPITALVPLANISTAWPDTTSTFPRITYREQDNFTTSDDIADNDVFRDRVQFAVDIWAKGSTWAIFQAVNTALETAGYNRDSAVDLYEEDTKIHHKAMSYTKVLYR